MNVMEHLVASLLIELLQDLQTGIAAGFHHVESLIGSLGDSDRVIESTLALDGLFDLVETGIALPARIAVIGLDLLQCQHHWGRCDGIGGNQLTVSAKVRCSQQCSELIIRGAALRAHGSSTSPKWGNNSFTKLSIVSRALSVGPTLEVSQRCTGVRAVADSR